MHNFYSIARHLTSQSHLSPGWHRPDTRHTQLGSVCAASITDITLQRHHHIITLACDMFAPRVRTSLMLLSTSSLLDVAQYSSTVAFAARPMHGGAWR